MKILILGGGVSGVAAKRLADLLQIKSEIVSDNDEKMPDFAGVDYVVASPGVGGASPIMRKALELGLEVISELEFGFRNLPDCVKLLSITGTNGKTTTTELTTHILQKIGKNACYAGNIGLPLSDVAADIFEGKLNSELIVAVEVSSFQLEKVRDYRSVAAVILNIVPVLVAIISAVIAFSTNMRDIFAVALCVASFFASFFVIKAFEKKITPKSYITRVFGKEVK